MPSIKGTSRARFPLVFLATKPPADETVCPCSSSPGDGVVWRQTVQIHSSVLKSRTRHPETSPMRATVHASKMTASPQPWYWRADRAPPAFAWRPRTKQPGFAARQSAGGQPTLSHRMLGASTAGCGDLRRRWRWHGDDPPRVAGTSGGFTLRGVGMEGCGRINFDQANVFHTS
jgi:hypothetical protein